MTNNKSLYTLSALSAILLLSGQCSLAADVTGTLIRTIDTSKFNPPSPDPSGIAYLSSSDTLLVCDGEVDEMASASWAAGLSTWYNLHEIPWEPDPPVTFFDSIFSTTNESRTGWSNEPVGCAYNPANGDLFISDDDQKKVFQIRPGGDGILFTSDDTRTSFSAPTVCGSSIDAEGLAYGAGTLFIIDGVGMEVWKVLPGIDGIFGSASGAATDETCTSFDTSSTVGDPEGGEYDPDNPGHLFVVGKPATRVAYYTTAGTLEGTIDISTATANKPAGLAAVPKSVTGSNTYLYVVDRHVDNNSSSNENDGEIYQFSLPGTTPGTNQPPSVSAGVDQVIYQPVTGAASTKLGGTVTDDGLSSPLTIAWSKSSGPSGGTVTFSPSASTVDPTASFSSTGTYVLQLTANDGALSGSDDVSIEVNPPLPVSTLYLTTQSSGTVSGISFGDEDILAYDTGTGTWSMYFDGEDVGLGGSGVDVDAIQRMADGSILLSFVADASITIPMQPNCSTPVAVSVDDSDILKFTPSSTGPNTTGCFEWYFDGSDVELTASAEDVDAIGFTPGGNLIISTTGNPTVTGAAGAADEDLLVFTPSISGASPACTSSTEGLGAETCGTWALYFDGSAAGLSDTTENIDDASINKNSGDIYLTTKGAFSVTGVTGDGNDIFICDPTSAVPVTSCTYSLLADLGGASGLGSNNIDGFDTGTSPGGGNTAPVNTVPGAQSVNQNTALSISGLSVNDVDGNLATTRLTVLHGVLNVGLGGGATISGGANGSASLTLSGSQTQINAALGTLSYTGVSDYNGSDTLTVLSTDSASTPLSDTDTVAITVNPVGGGNTAPVNTVPGAQTVNQNTALSIVGLSVIDVDGNLATTRLTVLHGTLTVTLGEATISGGANGSASLTLSGTQAQINAALGTLSYQGVLNYNGSDTLTVLSTDSASTPLSDTDTVAITVNPVGGVTILESRVSGSSDDAEEVVASGVMDLKSSDLEMMQESAGTQTVGMRFNNLTIPQGATITKAYIQFTVDEVNTALDTSLTIQGQAAVNASTFTATANDISLRPKTSASVSWSPDPWAAVGDALPAQQTPDISDIVREIVNLSGGEMSNHSLAVIITGTGKRVAIAYNGVAASAPLLHVEYQ